MSEVDDIMPTGKWQFDVAVTEAFDDMLRRSIPQYDVMRQLVFTVGSAFVQRKTDIIDLGCSRGEAIAPFVDAFGAYNRYVACEISEPMLEVCKQRFKGYIENGLMRVLSTDLRTDFPPSSASLIMSVLTLQFVPIEYRQRLVSQVYEHLVSGGAFVLVEKVLGEGSRLHDAFADTYHERKRQSGYTQEQVERKALSLEGVLVPVTSSWNGQMLRAAGFAHVDCFWRFLNFAAWVAVK